MQKVFALSLSLSLSLFPSLCQNTPEVHTLMAIQNARAASTWKLKTASVLGPNLCSDARSFPDKNVATCCHHCNAEKPPFPARSFTQKGQAVYGSRQRVANGTLKSF